MFFDSCWLCFGGDLYRLCVGAWDVCIYLSTFYYFFPAAVFYHPGYPKGSGGELVSVRVSCALALDSLPVTCKLLFTWEMLATTA